MSSSRTPWNGIGDPRSEHSCAALVDFSRTFGYLEVAGPDNGGHPEHPEILIVGNPPGML